MLVKEQILRLKEPSLRCVQLVHDELQRISQDKNTHYYEMMRFPKMHKKLINGVTKILQRRLPIALELVGNLISHQLAYIYKRHPEFVRDTSEFLRSKEVKDHHSRGDDIKRLSDRFKDLFPKSPSVKNGVANLDIYPESFGSNATEDKDCEIIRRLVQSYFDIVRRAIQDSVPKAIMDSLVNYVQKNLQSELTCQLYKPDDIGDMLAEAPHISLRRQNASDTLQALKKANQLISDFHEYPMEF